jgi:hypothetical protein
VEKFLQNTDAPRVPGSHPQRVRTLLIAATLKKFLLVTAALLVDDDQKSFASSRNRVGNF